jgi:integrase
MAWKKRWGYEMSAARVRPGIYRLKTGGFFLRSLVTDKLGKRQEITEVMHDAKTVQEAQSRLDVLVADARAAATGVIRTRQSWLDYAVSRLEQRIQRKKMQSEATVEWWRGAIAIFAEEWGHLDVRDVTKHHIELWLAKKVSVWMTEGRTVLRKRRVDGELRMVPFTTVIKPPTVNGWLRVLRAISHAIRDDFDLPKSAFTGVEFFEEGELFTDEEPNALSPEQLHQFMKIAREKFPQHFAMMLLGFVTGLRPSSLRAIRRSGPTPDIDWQTGKLIVRRSHSRKQLVMNRTKQKKTSRIALPVAVLDVLKEHVAALTEKQRASDLLFPSDIGGFRTRQVLHKPFAAIAAEMGLPFKLTPKGMRRTFNDVARLAGIHDVVTRSISGHQTETMQVHYSTARDDEQRAALTKTHALIAGAKDAEEPS